MTTVPSRYEKEPGDTGSGKELSVPSALLQGILHDPDSRVPTSPAAAAVIALVGSWTVMNTRRSFLFARRDGAYWQAVAERRRCVHKVGGVSYAEIRWNSAARSAICLDGLVLPGWKPKVDARQVFADANDVAEVIDALQVARIMPAEVAVLGPAIKSGDGVYPFWVDKALEALLHCRLDVRKRISAAQRVTMEANRFRKLLQQAADTAPVGRKSVAVPWHLAGIAQRSADRKSLFFR